MTPTRREKLEKDGVEFNQQEREAGYHFCFNWDSRVVGPIDPEWQKCHCPSKKTYESKRKC